MMLQDTTTQLVQDAAASSEAIRTAMQTGLTAPGLKFDLLDVTTWQWDAVLWNNSLRTWAVAISIAVVIQLVFWLFRKFVILGRARKLASKSASLVDDFVVDLVSDARYWWVATLSIVAGSKVLTLSARTTPDGPPGVTDRLHTFAVIVTALQLLITSRIIVQYAIQSLLKRTTHADGTVDETVNTSTSVLRVVGMVVLCSIILLLALENIGLRVSPLLTGLGIGGIAIALAAQNILGDLFASFIIIFDKPFVVGDYITAGDKSGTVEKIGVKTTRVRALSGEQLVFGNSSLLGSTVQNFKRMQERRVTATYGFTYDTPAVRLRAIPDLVKAAVERHKLARFERCHFKQFGAFSLDFEHVYWVTSPDYTIHKDIQHALNIELVEVFAEHNIEFAFPTQVEIVKDYSRPGEDKDSKRG